MHDFRALRLLGFRASGSEFYMEVKRLFGCRVVCCCYRQNDVGVAEHLKSVFQLFLRVRHPEPEIKKTLNLKPLKL